METERNRRAAEFAADIRADAWAIRARELVGFKLVGGDKDHAALVGALNERCRHAWLHSRWMQEGARGLHRRWLIPSIRITDVV